MASVVTMVSRFCYRSPTRPLFVAGLIFLILITWKFLVAQPDASALIMNSKAEKTWSERHRVHPEQQNLRSSLLKPVGTEKGLKRLVNKLPENEDLGGADRQDKQDDSGNKLDKVVEGEAQNGDRIEKPAKNSKQNVIPQESTNVKIEKAKNEGLVIEKSVAIGEKKLQNKRQDEFENVSEKANKNWDENNEKESVSSKRKSQSETLNGSQHDKPKENNNYKQGSLNKGKRIQESSSINHPGFQSLDALKIQELPSNRNLPLASTKTTQMDENKHQATAQLDYPVGKYNILLTLVKMTPRSQLAMGMKKFLKSLCRHTSIKLTLHAVVDEIGKMVVEDFFKTSTGLCKETQVVIHNVNKVIKQLKPFTSFLQKFFSRENSYYSDPIFFLSTAIHKVFIEKIKRVIVMDVDLRFVTDIKKLFDMFNNFNESNIIGIVQEQSPVYRHILYRYRDAHKGTLLGEPPPKGITGFNSGVVLLDLENMRKSYLYNRLLQGQEIKRLSEKYTFHGHLGDQDFFTLLSFEYPDLFYTLPCSWNRQLCTYWRDNGYSDVWDQYFNCTGPIHVYHGNCRTPIPIDNER